MAVVRYLVDDVDAAIAFYTDGLGFTLDRRMGPVRRAEVFQPE
jgi:catechol 2,3-dioxygenase-like lactoylglutathione lyase family enzyme